VKKFVPKEDWGLWGIILESIPGIFCPHILVFLEISGGNVSVLTENIREKAYALEKKNIKEWGKILKKEGAFLAPLEKQKNITEFDMALKAFAAITYTLFVRTKNTIANFSVTEAKNAEELKTVIYLMTKQAHELYDAMETINKKLHARPVETTSIQKETESGQLPSPKDFQREASQVLSEFELQMKAEEKKKAKMAEERKGLDIKEKISNIKKMMPKIK